jgi:hypothetical protein
MKLKSLFFVLSLFIQTIYAATPSQEKEDKELKIEEGTLIIKQGKPETGVKNYLLNQVEKGSIKDLKAKEEQYLEEKNTALKDDFVIVNKKLKYAEGQVLTVNALFNNPTVVEFYDALKNRINFKYITTNSPYFTVEQDKVEKNRIFITPTQKFRNGTLLIGTDIFDFPIQIKVQESSKGTEYSNYVQILTEKVEQKSNVPVFERFKEAIFSEEINLNNFKNYPEVSYEMWSIEKGKMIFADDAMKIYFLENKKTGNYLVLLNKNFRILGYDETSKFKEYNNDYNIYLLDFNTNVFTILSKDNFKSLKSEEKLRIIIRN